LQVDQVKGAIEWRNVMGMMGDLRALGGGRLRLAWVKWAGSLVIADVVALGLAWTIAGRLNQFYLPIPPSLQWWTWLGLPSLFWVFAAVTLVLLSYVGVYGSARKDYVRIWKVTSSVFCLSLVLSYFYDPKLDIPRSLFFTAWVSSLASLTITRLGVNIGLDLIQRHQTRRVCVVASSTQIEQYLALLMEQPAYQVVQFIQTSHTSSRLSAFSDTDFPDINFPDINVLDTNTQEVNVQRTGSQNTDLLETDAQNTNLRDDISPLTATQALIKQIQKTRSNLVILGDLPENVLASTLYWQLRRDSLPIWLIPSSADFLRLRGTPEIVAGVPLVQLEVSWWDGWDYRAKRLLDLGLALFGVVVFSPVFLMIAIAIRATSPGAAFYRQARVGLHGRQFQMWKFRTMVTDADRQQAHLESQNETRDGIMFKLKDDPRITPIGHLLRRTSLDELPQLFNVLLGEMSLVGPRPLPVRDVARFAPHHHLRHQVLPGITGLWQVSGRSDIDDFDDVLRLDLHYIDHWSFQLDLEILAETVKIALFGRGAY